MKIAVTAASGQLGSSIVRSLVNEIGHENVIGIVRTPERAMHLGVEIRKGDYNSREDLNEALKGVDAVLLVSGMDDPQKRIPQHRNVINAAKQNQLKKIVYTSIIGDEEKNAFSPIVQSNRQTEEDVKNSGLDWVIGRNGIYIEPDLEYIDTYVKEGGIRNCSGDGRCCYTSRSELGYAYAKMLLDEGHNGSTYNLGGEAISQSQVAEFINQVYQTQLSYQSMTVEEYANERRAALGDFLGTVIAGIYEGMLVGAYDVESHYQVASGRAHQSPLEMIQHYHQQQN